MPIASARATAYGSFAQQGQQKEGEAQRTREQAELWKCVITHAVSQVLRSRPLCLSLQATSIENARAPAKLNLGRGKASALARPARHQAGVQPTSDAGPQNAPVAATLILNTAHSPTQLRPSNSRKRLFSSPDAWQQRVAPPQRAGAAGSPVLFRAPVPAHQTFLQHTEGSRLLVGLQSNQQGPGLISSLTANGPLARGHKLQFDSPNSALQPFSKRAATSGLPAVLASALADEPDVLRPGHAVLRGAGRGGALIGSPDSGPLLTSPRRAGAATRTGATLQDALRAQESADNELLLSASPGGLLRPARRPRAAQTGPLLLSDDEGDMASGILRPLGGDSDADDILRPPGHRSRVTAQHTSPSACRSHELQPQSDAFSAPQAAWGTGEVDLFALMQRADELLQPHMGQAQASSEHGQYNTAYKDWWQL